MLIEKIPAITTLYGRYTRLHEINATKAATDKTKTELSEDEKKVLAFIKAEPQITQKKLQQATGISLGTIKRILPKLQEKGVIMRTGSRRSGKWNIRE